MNVLAVDTSTDSLALALSHGEARTFLRLERGLAHAASLLPWIDRILADAGLHASALDLLVCAVGPGSFTGIRIGIATVQGLALAIGRPAVGVGTLDVLAWPLRFHEGAVIPVIDARKGRFYAAAFQDGVNTAAPLDLAPDDLRAMAGSARNPVFAGPDAERVRERLGIPVRAAAIYDPSALLYLGLETYKTDGVQDAGPSPLYLRRSEAENAAAGS